MYDGAIASFWLDGFAALPPGTHILDIASGNAPLPRLMLSLDARPDLVCHAIDLADIAPAWLDELPASARQRVRFRGSCQAETLPFPDASFGMVISQWGLEYSDLDRSVPELLRVLAPDGLVRLITHNADALPVRLANDEISHLEWLLEARGLVSTVADLLGPMALSASAEGRARLQRDAQANALRAHYNVLQDAIEARIAKGGCVDALHEARQQSGLLFVAAASEGEARAREGWQAWRTTLEDSLLRLRELRSHAMDEAAARALAGTLAAHGSYSLAPLFDGEAIMGWTISVRRQP